MTDITFTTPETDALCREIAEKSRGTVFLMFSGKDSLCAWLQLRRYCSRIIPFHCSSIPHMEFVDRTLDYYEMMFQTRILRMMGEDLTMALVRHVYQEYPWECDRIDEEIGPIEDYNKLLILSYLRKEYNLPRAWCAVGISMYDSIDRMIYCKKYKGKNDANRTFYPCYNWTRTQVVDAIAESGLKLSSEYRYARRSIGGVPSATYNRILMEHYPRDWERTKLWYPLAEVKNKREEMIDANYPKWLEQRAAERGGRMDVQQEAGEEEGGGEGVSSAEGGAVGKSPVGVSDGGGDMESAGDLSGGEVLPSFEMEEGKE